VDGVAEELEDRLRAFESGQRDTEADLPWTDNPYNYEEFYWFAERYFNALGMGARYDHAECFWLAESPEVLKSSEKLYDQWENGEIYWVEIAWESMCSCCQSWNEDDYDSVSGIYGDDEAEEEAKRMVTPAREEN